MANPQLARIAIAKTGTLIRKPVEPVFEAIVNPDITTRFWFSKGSGKLETGKTVRGNGTAMISPTRSRRRSWRPTNAW